jgi:hypothetical protein
MRGLHRLFCIAFICLLATSYQAYKLVQSDARTSALLAYIHVIELQNRALHMELLESQQKLGQCNEVREQCCP